MTSNCWVIAYLEHFPDPISRSSQAVDTSLRQPQWFLFATETCDRKRGLRLRLLSQCLRPSGHHWLLFSSFFSLLQQVCRRCRTREGGREEGGRSAHRSAGQLSWLCFSFSPSCSLPPASPGDLLRAQMGQGRRSLQGLARRHFLC